MAPRALYVEMMGFANVLRDHASATLRADIAVTSMRLHLTLPAMLVILERRTTATRDLALLIQSSRCVDMMHTVFTYTSFRSRLSVAARLVRSAMSSCHLMSQAGAGVPTHVRRSLLVSAQADAKAATVSLAAVLAAMDVAPECRICRQAPAKAKWCGRCFAAFYCCKAHQLADWPDHRANCVWTTID